MQLQDKIGAGAIIDAINAITEHGNDEGGFTDREDLRFYLMRRSNDLPHEHSKLIVEKFFSDEIVYRDAGFIYVNEALALNYKKALLEDIEKPGTIHLYQWILIKSGPYEGSIAITDFETLVFDTFGYRGRVTISGGSPEKDTVFTVLENEDVKVIGPQKEDIKPETRILYTRMNSEGQPERRTGYVHNKPLKHRCWAAGKDLFSMGYLGVVRDEKDDQHHALCEDDVQIIKGEYVPQGAGIVGDVGASTDVVIQNKSPDTKEETEEKVLKLQETLDKLFKKSLGSGPAPHIVAKHIIARYSQMLTHTDDFHWFKDKIIEANKIKEPTRYMDWMKSSELLDKVRDRAKKHKLKRGLGMIGGYEESLRVLNEEE